MTGVTGLTEEPASSRRSGSDVGDMSPRYEGVLAGLAEHSQDAVTLNGAVSQRFLEVSDSFCALTGYSREELLGRTATEVGLIGESPQRATAIASAERGLGVVYEPEIRRKDGTLRELEVSTLVLDDDKVVITISHDITERKQAQRELAAREARFRAAAESTRDGLAFISPVRDDQGGIVDFRFEYVNDAYCELVGFERNELLGRPLGDVFPGFVGSQRFVDCRQVSLTGEPCHTEDVAPANIASVPARAGLVLDVNITAMGENLVVSARDVTERRRVEAQLRASVERFQTAVGAMLDSFVIFSPIHDDRGEIVDFRYEYANHAYCKLVEREPGEVLGCAVAELFPSFPGSERFELYRQVALTGEPVTSELLGRQRAWAGAVFAERVFDAMVAPMGENLVVSSRDVTARWNAQQAHAAAEARFGHVIESAPDGMVIVNADGEIQIVNAQTEKLFGYTREELIGQNHELLVPEPLRERHRDHRATYTANPRARPMGADLELVARRKDGSELPVEISLSPLGDENETLICSTIRDVSARRQAEQELALRAELLGLAHDAVIVREPSEGRVTFWNREAEAVYGYSAAEAMGRVIHELLATVFPDSREALHQALVRDGHWSGELRHRCKDGSEILVSSRQALQRDADGRALSIIELNSDITAQRQAEAELRASRERLAEAERVGGVGSWEGDLTTGRVTYSEGLLALYGISADQFAGTVAAANELIYPEDRDHFRTQFEQAVDERSSFLIEYRVIRADGRVRTLRARGDIIVDDDGQPVRAIAIVQDLTDSKLTQEALQSTSAEFGRRANELQQLALRSANEPPDVPYAPLSARQLEIMQLVAQGLTNAAIGKRLHLTEGTIKWHVRQVLAKTNSCNLAEAIARVLGG